MAPPIRVVVPIDSMTPESWALAIAYADKIAAQSNPPPDVVLLTHLKQNLRHTSIESSIGPGAAKALAAGRQMNMPSGGTLRHETLQTVRGSILKAVVIAGYADRKMLDFIDGLTGVAGVVAVPDFPDSADQWIERWNPVVHGQERKPAASLIDDPLVERALKGLAIFVNLSHSMISPRDKGHVDDTLRILRAKGHELVPEKIKSWAIRNQWHPKAAQELADLAKKIGALKGKPSLARIYNAQGRYERWRDESTEG